MNVDLPSGGQRKAWFELQARLALSGFALFRRRPGGFRVHRGREWSCDLESLGEVEAFAERVGALPKTPAGVAP